jgi:hypothetical protein
MARRAPSSVIGILVVVLGLAFTTSALAARPTYKHRRHVRKHATFVKVKPKHRRQPRTYPGPRPTTPTSTLPLPTLPAAVPDPISIASLSSTAPVSAPPVTTPPVTTPPPTTPPSPPPPTSAGLIVGLNCGCAGWGGSSTADRLDLVTGATGTKWLREEIDWATVEPQPGVFDFSYYDHFMLLAAQRGLHVLATLYDTPSWAGPAYNAIPSDPSAFAQYVAAVVGRYGTNGSFWAQNPTLKGSAITTWEIWNEPYLSTGDDGNYDPAAYANLVKASAIAGRGADPNAKFLMAAEMQSAMANGVWQWWVDALYQAVPDLNNYFDGVAVHPYGSDVTTLNPIVPGQPYPNYGHVRRIEDIHQLFLNHGASDKPFWITEAGWSTCSDSSGCVTAAQQAANLATLFNDIHGNWSSFVHAAFIYDYGDGSQPTTTQGGYGLTYLDGSPKPALAIFQPQAAASA